MTRPGVQWQCRAAAVMTSHRDTVTLVSVTHDTTVTPRHSRVHRHNLHSEAARDAGHPPQFIGMRRTYRGFYKAF